MAYDKEENGFISVPAPEFGAIFMANIETKRDCFKHKIFGLPSSMANFVKEVKKGMVLFLFEYERRQLFGVYRAISDGEMNIVPNAFSSSGKQFSAQVRFMPIWYCSPLSENEFRDAIRENYFSARKFHFGLSDEQVHRLLRLFSSRKLKNNLPLRKLTTGVSNLVDEDHVMVSRNNFVTRGSFGIKHSNVDLEPSRSSGCPRSSRGVKRVNDDRSLIEHRVEDEDKVYSAEHVHYHDKKRRNGYHERLLRDNAAKNDLHVHSLTEKLGYSRDDWPSFSDRVKGEHKTQTDYTPAISNYMDNSHEPAPSRKNRTDAFWKIGTVTDDRLSSLDDRVGKMSHLDPDINSTIASECFVNPPYNLKGVYKDGRLFTREISGNESKFCTDLGRGFDHQEATDDVCFLSRRKGANENCVDRFIIPAASNGNAAYAGEVGRQVVEIGNYPTNDFNGLVPGTENFQRPVALAECTAYSPMKKRTSGYSIEFLAETKSPHSTEAQNLGPSRSEFHDATITRVMPYKHEFPSSCYGHNSTYEVEEGSKSVQKPSYDLHRENNFASAKGISSPYSYPEFTKRGLESNSEDGKRVLLRSQDGFRSPLNAGASEAMEQDRSGSFVYETAFIPRPSITQQLTRDDLNEGKSWRFSSKVALNSTASHSFSGDYQHADEDLVDEHVIWQWRDGTHIGRRSYSPNTNWLLHQGNVLTNLDHGNSPGADIVNDEYEGNILTDVVHSDSRNSRGSVFSRLSLAPKVPLLREQKADHSMSYDKYYMDTTVDEIMDMLYEDQNIVPKRPLIRKPFDQKVGYGDTNKSLKHAAVVKNNTEQPADSMMRVLRKSANEALEEAVNHVLAETRVVDFKRRKEANRASENTNAKFNKEEKSSANEHTVLQNAQENSSEAAVAKESADKPFKRRKLVRPVFDETNPEVI